MLGGSSINAIDQPKREHDEADQETGNQTQAEDTGVGADHADRVQDQSGDLGERSKRDNDPEEGERTRVSGALDLSVAVEHEDHECQHERAKAQTASGLSSFEGDAAVYQGGG